MLESKTKMDKQVVTESPFLGLSIEAMESILNASCSDPVLATLGYTPKRTIHWRVVMRSGPGSNSPFPELVTHLPRTPAPAAYSMASCKSDHSTGTPERSITSSHEKPNDPAHQQPTQAIANLNAMATTLTNPQPEGAAAKIKLSDDYVPPHLRPARLTSSSEKATNKTKPGEDAMRTETQDVKQTNTQEAQQTETQDAKLNKTTKKNNHRRKARTISNHTQASKAENAHEQSVPTSAQQAKHNDQAGVKRGKKRNWKNKSAAQKSDSPQNTSTANAEQMTSLANTTSTAASASAPKLSAQPTADWTASADQQSNDQAKSWDDSGAANTDPALWSGVLPKPRAGKNYQQDSRQASRQRNNKFDKTVKKESPWPRKKDIPKGDSRPEKRAWSIASVEKSIGWATRDSDNASIKKPAADGRELADYTGQLAHPAIDRSEFTAVYSTQRLFDIKAWHATTEKALSIMDREISLLEYRTKISEDPNSHLSTDRDVAILLGAIAPTYWRPIAIENKSPDMFWQQLLESQSPKAVEGFEIDKARPWWDESKANCSPFLMPYAAPKIVGNDPTETADNRKRRLHDFGSQSTSEQYIKKMTASRRARENEPECVQPQLKGDLFEPALNMHIRLVTRHDFHQIQDIMNGHMQSSTDAQVHEHELVEQWRSLRDSGLPFLVACEKLILPKKEQKQINWVGVPDKIIAFAMITHSNRNRSCEATKEIQVLELTGYEGKGVDKCLIDKALKQLDPSYKECTRCETCITPLHDERHVEPFHPDNVLITCKYKGDDLTNLHSIEEWLVGMYGFESAGSTKRYERIGKEWLSAAYFEKALGVAE